MNPPSPTGVVIMSLNSVRRASCVLVVFAELEVELYGSFT